MKIITIIGARPQFVKAAVVSQNFSQHGIKEIILHTGQHFDDNMSKIFFKELDMPKPSYNLGIGGGLHGAMTGAQLADIEEILISEKPDWVLVYGDTNSTLAGALAATKLHIPVAHVEAGLRSFNREMPEEINRVVTDHISKALFAPTTSAMQHLAHEGIPAEYCHQTGDVMYDAALLFGEYAKQRSTILQQLNLSAHKYILTTVHRAENTDNLQRLKVILQSLNQVSETLPVIWPVHPRTRKLLEQKSLDTLLGNRVQLLDPVGYLDMLMLEQHAAMITTDSGGVQKEAFFYEIPCVTLRNETEWVELVEAGWNRLIKFDDAFETSQAILKGLSQTGKAITPYGSGDAAVKITSYFKDL